MKKLEITFGAMTKPLVDQCRAQELALPAADARELQRDADAITRLCRPVPAAPQSCPSRERQLKETGK